jgi:hypothetical protein
MTSFQGELWQKTEKQESEKQKSEEESINWWCKWSESTLDIDYNLIFMYYLFYADE